MTASTCPKCGKPRVPEALDCPWCGVIFARLRGAPAVSSGAAGAAGAAEAVPEPAGAVVEQEGLYDGPDLFPSSGDLYAGPPPGTAPARGGAAGRLPAAGAVAGAERVPHFETPFTRALPVSLIAAALLFCAMQALWASAILGGSADPERGMTAFRLISGLEPPAGLEQAATINFVGRRVIILSPSAEEAERADAEQRFELGAVVVHQGRLAGNASREDMLALVDRLLDLGKVPRFVISEREVEFAGKTGLARTLGLGVDGREAARVFALSFTAHDGRPALLVVAGPTVEVTAAVRRYLL